MKMGVIVNCGSFAHEHFRSVIYEGLWGFPLDSRSVNLRRWELLEAGSPILLYGEYRGVRGVWAICRLLSKERTDKPVKYWVLNPKGYPLHIRFKFILPVEHSPSFVDPFRFKWFDRVKPVRRDELASVFGISIFRALQDRWSLFVFGDRKERGVTYSFDKFEAILNEFEARNKVIESEKLGHDEVKELLFNIGQIQGKYPVKEYPLEDKRVDVVWRRTSKSVPYIVFEIHIKGDLYADLVKLKHAFDLWNAIPILVVADDKVNEARKWISGTFHEVKEVFRVIPISKIKEFYNVKKKAKEIESELGIV